MNEKQQHLSKEYCITCADQAVPARVINVNPSADLALVELENKLAEIDIALIERVAPGDIVLVHAGVAIGYGASSSD